MDFLPQPHVLCIICQENLVEDGGEYVEIVSTVCGHVYHRAYWA